MVVCKVGCYAKRSSLTERFLAANLELYLLILARYYTGALTRSTAREPREARAYTGFLQRSMPRLMRPGNRVKAATITTEALVGISSTHDK
jgi:hypothetical protein